MDPIERIVALYAEDATFESPLVRPLMQGLIRQHRVYWGWIGVRNLEKN